MPARPPQRRLSLASPPNRAQCSFRISDATDLRLETLAVCREPAIHSAVKTQPGRQALLINWRRTPMEHQ
jgi:hypothetical protein